MSRPSILINCAFILAVVLSILLIKKFASDSHYDKKVYSNHSPDAYMINASFVSTDEQGHCEVKATAPYATHYPYRNSSKLIQPDIYVYHNQEQWHITSKMGDGIDGIQTFFLNGAVRVTQLPSDKNTGTRLATESLTLFPKQSLVTSDCFVSIEQPGIKINAIGFRGDFKTGNLELLSKTRGLYDPQKIH